MNAEGVNNTSSNNTIQITHTSEVSKVLVVTTKVRSTLVVQQAHTLRLEYE